ncbi:MAG: hypothetical protein JEZ12_07510 [Desulfobacterium sp.]|nr:hypothetical protein [Desulfobacterium sp.]
MAGIQEKKVSNKLPPLTLFLIVLSAVLVVGVALVVLFPQYRENQQIKQARVSAAIELEKQKKLYPMFAQAQALATMAFDPELPRVEKVPLARDKIATLSTVFTGIARENGMELSSNSLDINSLKNRSDSVSMELTFAGDLFDYRNCLVSLVSLPYLNTVETIKITTDKEQEKKFFTKILINIDKK